MGIDATRDLSKRPEGFELAKIPKYDKIDLKKYFKKWNQMMQLNYNEVNHIKNMSSISSIQ